MIQFRCTKKVQQFMGAKPEYLSEPREPAAVLGNWYLNMFMVERRNVMLYMNERTLFSFIMYGLKKTDPSKVISGFANGLPQLLEIEGFSTGIIDGVLADIDIIELTKTTSKQMLGNMNQLVFGYSYLIPYEGGLNNADITGIIRGMNRTPMTALKGKYPIDVVKEILGSDGLASQ